MTGAPLDRLRSAAEALSEEVSRALWRAHAGHAADAPLAALYARHAAAYGPEALPQARELLAVRGAPARALAEWVAETRVARALAPHDDGELAWERRATVALPDGGRVEYARVPIVMANAADRGTRLQLESARAALVGAELAPLRRERASQEHEATASLGMGDDYLDAFARTSGIDARALGAAAEALLRDTQGMWDDVRPAFVRRRLGAGIDAPTRADVPALFRAPEFDVGFPPGGMLATVRTQLAAMGVDPDAGGRVRYDVGERPGKRARAFCAPVRVPDEVHLVLRPMGGAQDWRTLLHEVGHALHFANAGRGLPFEARWAGDHSVTEGYAMLLDHLVLDAGWLRRYSELDAARTAEWRRLAAFQELYLLRRYAGKLRYELLLHGGLPLDAAPDAYVELMEDATGVRHDRADAFVDVDPRLYVVRYLRAWQLQALLAGALRERYDEDWWRNPRAGPWLVGTLMAEGQALDAEGLARRVDAGGLSFDPLVRGLEATLA
ncbi:hypothetical protein [Roseisolibacter sp. H3M3-2]|uniref:hypothetical protein n=1 Tax=Roseisolibacter sp. H3M3-2 TaxID=3031323 RepID=UPI0023DA5117|nr:hypothetical protein [Roseisolibacter sp. H3M3-2]MDF1505216.1 hypothetical protein [Roseisolibacter sp. H3M3-2]